MYLYVIYMSCIYGRYKKKIDIVRIILTNKLNLLICEQCSSTSLKSF